MAKSSSLAEIHPQTRPLHGEGKTPRENKQQRKRVAATLARRVEFVGRELAALPVKPLLIGAGVGAAVVGVALSVSSKQRASSPFRGMNHALTKTALVALARVVSGQTMRSVATSALLDVADAVKKS